MSSNHDLPAPVQGAGTTDFSRRCCVWRCAGRCRRICTDQRQPIRFSRVPRRKASASRSRALASLDRRVQALVDDQQIVGGELLVIKRGRTVLRKAYGWKDRDAGTHMPVNAVYCVRSMTKPLVGTASADADRCRTPAPGYAGARRPAGLRRATNPAHHGRTPA